MATVFEKLATRPDYVETVYSAMLDAIIDGSLAPGARLTQEEIAEQFAVSRSPVLQALRLLKKDGLVEDAPGRGVQVIPLDLALIGMLYEVRGALDGLAARLAAQRRSVIDPQLIKNGRLASKGKDVSAMISADMAFHTAIYAASGNPLIGQSAQLHWIHLRRVMGLVLRSSEQRESIWNEHEAIAAAIAAGDPELAVQMTDLHISHARASHIAHLGKVLA